MLARAKACIARNSSAWASGWRVLSEGNLRLRDSFLKAQLV